jgi:uncharacterized protein (DUF2236 family)
MTSSTLFPSEQEIPDLLVGPESVTWRFSSDSRLYFTMLYPLLLQVAHPVVGAGVRDYSDFEQRPWNRLLRTIDYVTVLVYGGPDAVAMGRRLRGMHKGFQGTREDGKPYYALEPEAYAWVHATLLETYIAGHARFGRPMRRDQIDRFYREYRGLGRLIGVRERDLPDDYASFKDYFDTTCEEVLVRTKSVDRVIEATEGDVPAPLPMPDLVWRAARLPAKRTLWLGGVGMLTPTLRERFGLTWSRSDELAFRALGRASRRATPIMPKPLRIAGPGQLRFRRRAIARGPLGPRADAPRADAPRADAPRADALRIDHDRAKDAA